jgi:hypothetical protein
MAAAMASADEIEQVGLYQPHQSRPQYLGAGWLDRATGGRSHHLGAAESQVVQDDARSDLD